MIVRLTPAGLALVDKVAVAHMATEAEILADLSPRQRAQLANLLRIPLLTLGDDAAAFGPDTEIPGAGFVSAADGLMPGSYVVWSSSIVLLAKRSLSTPARRGGRSVSSIRSGGSSGDVGDGEEPDETVE